ncbi:MAG: alpha/beta fold hydrolase [Gammaproteobacteria bacterium]|nr:alpha/beta fold hydrolase [Gammaproteobacteria bacterium]
MPHTVTDDGVRLYYEDTGNGYPIVFVHEFAGDYRSWELQVRRFSRKYRCITFNARGYPPSDAPTEDAMYSQDRARDDIRVVLDHLDIASAHIVGHSMGAFAALHFGLRYGERARALVLAGCGYGAKPSEREEFQGLAHSIAQMFRSEGIERAARTYALFPGREQFKAKDPRGWAQFAAWLSEHSAEGLALTMINVQAKRPSLWDLADALAALRAPTLIITGDEDQPCLEPGLFMKRTIPSAGLAVIPRSGHTINSEEPDAFNRAVDEFLSAVELDRWA